MTPDDLPQVAALEHLLFPNALSLHQLGIELKAGEGLVYGRPIQGYALLRQDGELYDVTRLAVHPTCQRQGIGGKLLDHILARGKPVVLTVQKDNWAAFRLYRKHGFDVIGHISVAKAWVLRWAPDQVSAS